MKSKKSEQGAWAKRNRRKLETRHSHENALTDREFIQLLEGYEKLPDPYRFEARFICLIAAHLGLRGGEIAHLQAECLDWDRKHIRIPPIEECECGYCRRQARQEAKHTQDLTFEEALESRWHPKTAASTRVVPFDVSLRLELTIERFANRFDAFPKSGSTINRRVKEAAEKAGISGRVYPHCLRATGASFHVYRGQAPVPL